jgi:hypothetical protein
LEDTHFTKNEKSKNEQVESESNDDRFLRHQRCIMIEWVPVGQTVNQRYCPDQAPRMSEEEKAGTVEEEIMDSASRQCTSSHRPHGEAVFSR